MYWSFITITPSQWLVLGAIFAVLCLFMPKRIPMTICGAAIITGVGLFVYKLYAGNPAAILLQILLFLGLLALGLFVVRPKAPHIVDDFFPCPKAVFALDMPIENGRGAHTHDGVAYDLIGPDAPIGAQVSIISIRGQTLYIDVLSQ